MTYGLFDIPKRTEGCMAGTALCSTLYHVSSAAAREQALEQQLLLGNLPWILRVGVPVEVSYGDHHGVFWASPDYVCIGDNEDYVRVPLNPLTASKIARVFGAVLPTRKMVNDIWRAAAIRLSPRPMPPTAEMTSVAYFVKHNELIEEQLSKSPEYTPGALVAGHKKDVVISASMTPGHVAIYGWHQKNGVPIQGPKVQATAHSDRYSDYSHGIRLIAREMLVDGEVLYVDSVLRDMELAPLLSDEGVLKVTRYPEPDE